MKFLTDTWIDKFEARAKEVFSEENTPTSLTVTLVECYESVPQLDGKDFWHLYAIEDGVIEELDHGNDKDDIPNDADFVTFCPYDLVVKIMTGEVSTPRAMLSGSIKMKGNMVRAMKMLETYNILQDLKRLDGETEW